MGRRIPLLEIILLTLLASAFTAPLQYVGCYEKVDSIRHWSLPSSLSECAARAAGRPWFVFEFDEGQRAVRTGKCGWATGPWRAHSTRRPTRVTGGEPSQAECLHARYHAHRHPRPRPPAQAPSVVGTVPPASLAQVPCTPAGARCRLDVATEGKGRVEPSEVLRRAWQSIDSSTRLPRQSRSGSGCGWPGHCRPTGRSLVAHSLSCRCHPFWCLGMLAAWGVIARMGVRDAGSG